MNAIKKYPESIAKDLLKRYEKGEKKLIFQLNKLFAIFFTVNRRYIIGCLKEKPKAVIKIADTTNALDNPVEAFHTYFKE